MSGAIDLIDPREYDFVVQRLRDFFRPRGFIETPVQHRLSILAACEDPRTVATFDYAGNVWPLPQTGQLWLEYELLTHPDNPGYYCISTSYRDEPDPIPGRHNLIFPMFEFETHGGMKTLKRIGEELLGDLGFSPRKQYQYGDYRPMAERLGVNEIGAAQEDALWEDFGPVFFLMNFPQHTSPFWNMRRDGDCARKIDIILYGIETIGSAERSTNPEEMRASFHAISDGQYAEVLYKKFGRERVEDELERFLALPFIPRCGGGIGITRMIRALRFANLLPQK